jgi:anaerobic selenocysteine-containing dehydrogenase
MRLAQELAVRLGLDLPIFRAAPAAVLAEMLRGAKGATAGLDPEELRRGGPRRLLASEAQEFRTPSGKLEFYSEQLAAQGLAPMPDWAPDPHEERDAARWKLRLLTAPGYFQAHTAYAGVAFLRRREGVPQCMLHPTDAAARGLTDGDKVRLYNERGAVGLVLRVSDEIQPGVVLVPGQRPDDETIAGTVNLLVSDRYTDLGEGATYQSTFLDVEAWRDASS